MHPNHIVIASNTQSFNAVQHGIATERRSASEMTQITFCQCVRLKLNGNEVTYFSVRPVEATTRSVRPTKTRYVEAMTRSVRSLEATSQNLYVERSSRARSKQFSNLRSGSKHTHTHTRRSRAHIKTAEKKHKTPKPATLCIRNNIHVPNENIRNYSHVFH